MEDLRRRLEGYRSSLELMRRLVPDRNEVANLMDEISTRAKIRGVQVAQFTRRWRPRRDRRRSRPTSTSSRWSAATTSWVSSCRTWQPAAHHRAGRPDT